jgi:hypothetical protein
MRADATTRARLRTGLLVAIALLYALSIPWYRPTGAESTLWLGMPDWVAVALACYVAAAVLNALAWLLTDVRDDDGSADGEGG